MRKKRIVFWDTILSKVSRYIIFLRYYFSDSMYLFLFLLSGVILFASKLKDEFCLYFSFVWFLEFLFLINQKICLIFFLLQYVRKIFCSCFGNVFWLAFNAFYAFSCDELELSCVLWTSSVNFPFIKLEFNSSSKFAFNAIIKIS